jgi:hypothetical protein
VSRDYGFDARREQAEREWARMTAISDEARERNADMLAEMTCGECHEHPGDCACEETP